MKNTLLIMLLFLWMRGTSQQMNIALRIDSTKESREYWNKWLTDLYDMGVQSKDDSLQIKEEVIRLIKDTTYRNSTYPEKYKWKAVVPLLERMDLKKAFWHLINIYITDTASRKSVVGTLLLYDSLVQMDKILINSYYTYAFTDPQACRIRNNKPDIFRPDILEQKLQTTKEIIGYIYANRKLKSDKKY
jgi:hypothetical protein